MPKRAIATVTSAIICAAASAAIAQDTATDTFYQGQVIEFNAGLSAPLNTLQDTLTTLNGGGDTVRTTSVLDLGTGARIGLGYSRSWGNDARLVFSLSGYQANGDTEITIGDDAETFPGSLDDGFNLPESSTSDIEIETQTAMLKVGREWVLNGTWRVSAGLQAGEASQDINVEQSDTDGTFSTATTTSNNEMYGAFGGASYYRGINNTMGLRVSASVGVMDNSFTYDYTKTDSSGDLQQEVSGTASSTAISTQISARIEKSLTDRSMLTFELGYEGLNGIGNGVDTFLDVDGTATTADIDYDMIGAAYLSVGYAHRF